MESSSWQQEHMEKHRVLATARCRTLFFYSHSGSEKTRTFRFCLHSRTENPKKLIQGCTRPGTERLISDISDPDRQETERLSNVMNRNVLVRNVILSAMEQRPGTAGESAMARNGAKERNGRTTWIESPWNNSFFVRCPTPKNNNWARNSII